ncbi:MAG: hypothetical protein IH591_18680 [Bacteroidales bacterium]|nr:hypothetical protein [Bacteroidales bacterium]
MEKEKVYFFTPKFWPDWEYRRQPDASFLLEDDPAITDMFRYRQEMRLWYRNWIQVWRTYSWFNMHTPLRAPVLGLIFHSWLAAGVVLAFYVIFARVIGKYKYRLWAFKMLVPGFMDEKISQQFGTLLPYDDPQDESEY